ncbi:aminoglycoside phosphotransferase family protein [Streptomyces albiaxialis]|uniref:Aminoglycoside phosphotransferase family protein n=1 Tax=Streptomyces albiaxialis TaxID=329523 RepID=A0ABP5IM93_9ACTN
MTRALVPELYALAGGDPAHPDGAVLARRPDGVVVRHTGTVAKAHDPEADPAALGARLALAALPECAGILLPPSDGGRLVPLADSGRLASLWPYGTPVDPEAPEHAPWEAAGNLLARLHAVDADAAAHRLGTPLPPTRGPAKAARALARMRAAAPPPGPQARAAAAVERAWATLPPWCRDEAPPPRATTVCHGDFHLGQLVRHPSPQGPWHLIDVDDLGLGDPHWDLARPAAWYATGLLAPADWHRFLGAYAPAPDLWSRLDAPARALTVQTAALAVAKAVPAGRALDEAERACVDACARIAGLSVAPEVPAPRAP